MSWNKYTLTEYMRQNTHKKVTIEEPGGTFRVHGQLKDVVDLNLCSHILVESTLIPQIPNVEISLTFHDDFLGIHCLAKHVETSEVIFSFPAQIPYEKLQIQFFENT